eukprot:maker-scaffold389_size186684-snap-gene-0.27 protein:Tk00874 transcript:maker-scaffold389_size186684-snap-gene-0.27-mRNA-1 annotation:"conserved hypothetical protein"
MALSRGAPPLTSLLALSILLVFATETSADPGQTPNHQGGLFLPFPEGMAPDGTRYKTAYSCEGENMTITCEDPGSNPREMIQVVRGNFGRFSIALCNRHGQTDWSVNCMAPSTTNILKDRCDGLRGCTIPVQSSILPDACPGTHKYLEIHYACSSSKAPVVVQTNQHLPPWLQKGGNGPNQRKVWKPTLVGRDRVPHQGQSGSNLPGGPGDNDKVMFQATTLAPRKPILVTDKEAETPRVPITTPRPSTTTTMMMPVSASKPPPHPEEDDSPNRLDSIKNITDSEGALEDHFPASLDGSHPSEQATAASINIIPAEEDNSLTLGPGSTSLSFNPALWCPPTTARKLQWDGTQAGEEVVQPCPIGATGHARWTCVLVEIPREDHQTPQVLSRWASSQPDMSHCKSVAMTNLEAQVRKEDPENVLVSALAYLTRTKSLYGGDLETAVATMRTVANRIQYRLQQPTRNGGLQNKESHIRQVVQNVFRSANNVLDPINRQAWYDLNPDGQMKVATQLLLSLEENAFLLANVMNDPNSVLESSDILTLSVSVVDVTNRVQFPDKSSSVSALAFPVRGSNLLYVDDSVQISLRDAQIHAQGGLTEVVYLSFSNLHEIMGRAKIYLDRAGGTVDRQRVLNSRIISASLSQPGRHIQLSEPVQLAFRHLQDENMTDAVCVYWDIESHVWSDSGCRVISSNKTQTVCECDHLTNFAVAMVPTEGTNPSEAVFESILNRIDIIGSVVAAILVFCIVLFVFVFRRKMCGSPMSDDKCCCCLPSTILPKAFCTKDTSATNHKSQSFYSGSGGHGTASGALNKNSRTLLLNNSSRIPSQYVMSAKTLQHGVMGTVRVTPNGTATTLLPNGHHLSQHRTHITLNPYSTQLVDNINLMNPSKPGSTGSSSLDSGGGAMSPQLVQMGRGGGAAHDDVVYRAVSPHGHVYWEIDPSNPMLMHHHHQSQAASQLYDEAVVQPLSDLSDQSLEDRLSYSRQSSSRFSEQRPLISSPLQQPLLASVGRPEADALRPSTSMDQFGGRMSATPSHGGVSSTFVRTGANRFNSRNRKIPNKDESGRNVPEQLQTQVQIRDCKPIQVSVKSSEYIEAKIRTLRRNNNNCHQQQHHQQPQQHQHHLQ